MTDTATTDLFARLPGYLQSADEAQGDRPLLSYLSLPGQELERSRVLTGRLDRYTEETSPDRPSDLTDPTRADPAWLAWMAQFVGARLDSLADIQARRDAITYAPAGWKRATKAAIAGAARTALTGNKYLRVYPHSITDPGDSTWEHMLLVTRVSETPSSSAVLQAVRDQGAEPAGVQLHHRSYSATFAETRAALPADTLAARRSTFPTFRDAADYLGA